MKAGSAVPRARMVERLRERGVRDEAVLAAMARVPRHLFVPDGLRAEAYRDRSLPIGAKQTISQPWVVARMSELLRVSRGERVLEIGAGSGYQTAVLAELGVQVYSIERIASLARRAAALLKELGYLGASVKNFDGTYGWGEWAPYSGILVAAVAQGEPPPPLLEQLGDGGRLVIPLSRGSGQRLVLFEKVRGRIRTEEHEEVRFVPLVGRFGQEGSEKETGAAT